ncbi:MAG: hypothetical protein PHO62_07795 [Sulfurimonas sp.]|uniref:hypothetical protein n=1 Tax=Sulfurimonas sp. TaxID=2022749 RepID=UPI002636C73A|nr:hypothetical protein [Sulfurimonas sp.]MDD5373309.1 hypothetical protein [Sulfurimonas sp.]
MIDLTLTKLWDDTNRYPTRVFSDDVGAIEIFFKLVKTLHSDAEFFYVYKVENAKISKIINQAIDGYAAEDIQGWAVTLPRL